MALEPPAEILEALIPGWMQGYACTAEVPDELRERAVRMVTATTGQAPQTWA